MRISIRKRGGWVNSDDTQPERCDIYDVYGNRTGKTFLRGFPLKNGQYVMVVDIWVINCNNEILIQKRSRLKKDLPGTWATHSGCALAGESSVQAAMRELKEEIGIVIDPKRISKLNRKIRGKLLSENFIVEQEIDISDATLQLEEVSQIKWVSAQQLRKMVNHRKFYRYPEFPDVIRFIELRAKHSADCAQPQTDLQLDQ